MFDSKEKRKFTEMAVSMGNDIYNYNTIIKLFKNKEDFQEALDKKYITICGKNKCNENLYCLTELGKEFYK